MKRFIELFKNRDIFLYLNSNVVVKGLGLLSWLVIAHFLVPEEVIFYGYYMSFLGIALSIISAGRSDDYIRTNNLVQNGSIDYYKKQYAVSIIFLILLLAVSLFLKRTTSFILASFSAWFLFDMNLRVHVYRNLAKNRGLYLFDVIFNLLIHLLTISLIFLFPKWWIKSIAIFSSYLIISVAGFAQGTWPKFSLPNRLSTFLPFSSLPFILVSGLDYFERLIFDSFLETDQMANYTIIIGISSVFVLFLDILFKFFSKDISKVVDVNILSLYILFIGILSCVLFLVSSNISVILALFSVIYKITFYWSLRLFPNKEKILVFIALVSGIYALNILTILFTETFTAFILILYSSVLYFIIKFKWFRNV